MKQAVMGIHHFREAVLPPLGLSAGPPPEASTAVARLRRRRQPTGRMGSSSSAKLVSRNKLGSGLDRSLPRVPISRSPGLHLTGQDTYSRRRRESARPHPRMEAGMEVGAGFPARLRAPQVRRKDKREPKAVAVAST